MNQVVIFCWMLAGAVTQAEPLSSKGQEMPSTQVVLENFDDLFVGEPVEIEANLRKLLPQAALLKDHSIHLQILSQIACAQSMQKNFDDALTTLNTAEKQLSGDDHLARTRIILERGRILWQSGNTKDALPLFEESYRLSNTHGFDDHTCNAAHLIAIIADSSTEKIKWNKIAIALAEHSNLPRARAWLGTLYHNLGHAYIEEKLYSKALEALEQAEHYREQEKYEPNIRVAKWSIARALRFLGRTEESLALLLPLKKQYDSMLTSELYDMPKEGLLFARALIYEELTEIYKEKAHVFSKIAYKDLSTNEWFQKLEPERLERLRNLSQ